ncbi:flagellar brake protein [Marinisporobacter balticus]|uniref:C-di-GMP-binding flagellar brake protein YcgR n=1 Tax=Marinisporobacter balticus TaxID=2018667 RepID=A0A4R2L3X3_9FIRM|nr:flagellar brake protein [Marinisporobacter balticus]TCO79927.1 c-di-GMP-binding flagellar brake protein YcgR [Marinisporobacter balticus]
MVKTDLPNVGMKIGIELEHPLMNKSTKFVSQVMDIIDEKAMFIATPIAKNVLVPIDIGKIIKISYFKKNLGTYGFNAEVVERKNVGDISYMRVKKIGEVFRIQRRNFFRLEVLLNGEVNVIESQNGNEKTISVLTKDISGGGVRVISKEALEVGSAVEIKIETKNKPIVVQGEVLRCVLYEESNYNFDIGIIFKDIDKKEREQIIAFVFDYQRRMRKKGLI